MATTFKTFLSESSASNNLNLAKWSRDTVLDAYENHYPNSDSDGKLVDVKFGGVRGSGQPYFYGLFENTEGDEADGDEAMITKLTIKFSREGLIIAEASGTPEDTGTYKEMKAALAKMYADF